MKSDNPRRRFLGGLAMTIAAPWTLKSANLGAAQGIASSTTASYPSTSLPCALKPGSTIGVACPASGVTSGDLRDFIEVCKNMQIEVRLGRNVSKSLGYLSAPDQDRADEFMELVSDPQVDAIVCARGGYGVMRILPMLDYGAIREAGKVVMGFSDITALLIAVNQLSGLVTFHGPVASSTFNGFTVDALKSMVMLSSESESIFLTGSKSSAFEYQDERITTVQQGVARGRLTGGNLTMVVSTLGTQYEINTRGAILFLEEINEEPYKIDRMLTQLWLAGKLQECKAIVLGNFRNCESKGTLYSSPSTSLMKVINQRTKDLGIPVVYGMPFGHVKSKLTLPLGVPAELDADNKTLRFLQSAVSA